MTFRPLLTVELPYCLFDGNVLPNMGVRPTTGGGEAKSYDDEKAWYSIISDWNWKVGKDGKEKKSEFEFEQIIHTLLLPNLYKDPHPKNKQNQKEWMDEWINVKEA